MPEYVRRCYSSWFVTLRPYRLVSSASSTDHPARRRDSIVARGILTVLAQSAQLLVIPLYVISRLFDWRLFVLVHRPSLFVKTFSTDHPNLRRAEMTPALIPVISDHSFRVIVLP